MPTSIYKYDGTLLTTVPDSTLDTTHSTLKFPGKGYQSYGEPIMEDLVWMLQHFAGATAPTNALAGQCWYDTSTQTLKIYDSINWNSAGGVIIGSTAPVTGSSQGELWYDNLNLQLRTWNGTSWDLLGPLGSATNNDPLNLSIPSKSALDSVRLSDGANTHQVWRITVGGTLLAIISKDAAFTPAPSITGFASIAPGINFNSTLANIGVSGDVTAFRTNKTNVPTLDNTYDLGSSSYKFANTYSQNGLFSGALAVNAPISSYTLEVGGTSFLNGTVSLIGDTVNPPVKMRNGSLVVTPTPGAIEYDGSNFYMTSNVSGVTNRFAVTAGAAGNFSSNVTISSTTRSTSTTTGALVVSGGVGIAGNINVGGNIYASSATQILAGNSDSAAKPGFAWVDDPDTGLFNPTTGNVAISVNGTERIRVNGSGAVGLTGENYGTAGQVITSAGDAAPPTWTTFGVVPTGGVVQFAGATAPAGWLLCFGQILNVASYPALGAVLGSLYGGDGVTTFGVPDLRGRIAAGLDNMGGTAANRITAATSGIAGTTIGASGGAQAVTLTTAQMPAHNHGAGIGQNANSPAFVYGGKLISPLVVTSSMSEDLDNTTYQALTETIGGGNAHGNVQPTIMLNYLIKI